MVGKRNSPSISLSVLRLKRMSRGLRQIDVAKELDISQGQISMIENMVMVTNPAIIKGLAKLLRAGEEELFHLDTRLAREWGGL